MTSITVTFTQCHTYFGYYFFIYKFDDKLYVQNKVLTLIRAIVKMRVINDKAFNN